MDGIMMRVFLAGLLLAGATAPPMAQDLRPARPSSPPVVQFAAADRGRTLSLQMCAECHAIERGRTRSPNAEAPAFQAIANTPGMSPLALRAFLYSPHRLMPNIVLTRDEADDVIDYILSLASK
jgi:mono/diheme cytochrome c family protein